MAAAGAELLADADVIVPVPLYRSSLWSRRFNQSALLAQAVSRLAGTPVDCFLLARVKRTPSAGACRRAFGHAALIWNLPVAAPTY